MTDLAAHSVRLWTRRVGDAISRKVHANLLLELVPSLPEALRDFAASREGVHGLSVAAARQRLQERREALARDHARTRALLTTFRHVSRQYPQHG